MHSTIAFKGVLAAIFLISLASASVVPARDDTVGADDNPVAAAAALDAGMDDVFRRWEMSTVTVTVNNAAQCSGAVITAPVPTVSAPGLSMVSGSGSLESRTVQGTNSAGQTSIFSSILSSVVSSIMPSFVSVNTAIPTVVTSFIPFNFPTGTALSSLSLFTELPTTLGLLPSSIGAFPTTIAIIPSAVGVIPTPTSSITVGPSTSVSIVTTPTASEAETGSSSLTISFGTSSGGNTISAIATVSSGPKPSGAASVLRGTASGLVAALLSIAVALAVGI